MTWSAPARLQACSSTWSSSAAAIAAGCAGHLVDQSLARHTQTRHKPPTNTNTSHLVDQLLQLARSRGRPPAPGWPGRPRAARSTRTTYQVRTIAPRPAGHPPPCPEPRRTHQARRSAAGSRTAAGVPGACCRHAHAPGEGGGGATSPVPPDFGGPLRASGLCRGPCSDAPPTSLSKPTTTGLSPGLERLILMRIDARMGAIPAPG